MVRVKAFELRTKSKEQLQVQLDELKQELANLRVQKVTNPGSARIAQIGTVRKNIARVLTVLNSVNREALRELYNGKKHLPLDLRAKKTRAIRRQLTAEELARKTLKQKKKLSAFPQRKYAIKA
jgi:large subunit ribosomal protein L35e